MKYNGPNALPHGTDSTVRIETPELNLKGTGCFVAPAPVLNDRKGYATDVRREAAIVALFEEPTTNSKPSRIAATFDHLAGAAP
jgi:hypothetical protein